jgi:predicted DCC family thiol-disulfide oxidoreductase YuxK
MLDFGFRCYSPDSRKLHEFMERGETQLLGAEIERTATAFAAAAEGRIAKGLLTEGEARRAQATLAAIAADLAAERTWIASVAAGVVPPSLSDQLAEMARQSRIRWPDKVMALRQLIEARRRDGPAEVRKGRLTDAEARAQLERIEAVHAQYWLLGFAWESPTGAPKHSPTWWGELREHGELVHIAQLEMEGATP